MPKKAKTFFGNLEQALEADKNHIYIGNNLKGRAVLLLDIKDASGKSISVKIPKTWVPIDLMLFADREAIRRSDSIRKLHRKGAIRFLDATEADEIMKTQEAREEAKRAGLLSELGQDLVDMMAQEEEAKKSASAQALEVIVTNENDSSQNFFKNAINEIKGFADADDKENVEEEEIVKKILDMKSAWYVDQEGVTKGDFIIMLNDAKQALSNAGKSKASEEIQSIITTLEKEEE